MRQVKGLIVVLMAIILLIMPVGALAAPGMEFPFQGSDISPMWINVNGVYANLTFDGSKAVATAKVLGKSGTSSITTTVVLERKLSDGSFSHVKTWGPEITQGETALISGSYYVTKGYTYRLTVRAQVIRGGVVEQVSDAVEAHLGL